MKRTNIYLSDLQHQALTALSTKSDVSIAELVRRAIDEYLEKRGNKKLSEQTERATK